MLASHGRVWAAEVAGKRGVFTGAEGPLSVTSVRHLHVRVVCGVRVRAPQHWHVESGGIELTWQSHRLSLSILHHWWEYGDVVRRVLGSWSSEGSRSGATRGGTVMSRVDGTAASQWVGLVRWSGVRGALLQGCQSASSGVMARTATSSCSTTIGKETLRFALEDTELQRGQNFEWMAIVEPDALLEVLANRLRKTGHQCDSHCHVSSCLTFGRFNEAVLER